MLSVSSRMASQESSRPTLQRRKPEKQKGPSKQPGPCEQKQMTANQVRAAGRLDAESRIVFSTELGTCSKLNGSIE